MIYVSTLRHTECISKASSRCIVQSEIIITMNLCNAFQNELRSLSTTYEFKLKVNINVRWLNLLKLGYVAVLAVIMLLVYWTGGWNYKDTGISSLVVKVQGSDLSDGEIWDSVDYVYPPQEVKAFFITTRAAITTQKQSSCTDMNKAYTCKNDADCHHRKNTENGIQTGKCDKMAERCIISAWCPVENRKSNYTKIIHIRNAGNFTVYVRDHEEFIKFNISTSNDINSRRSSTNCLFNAKTNPLCPIFKVDDILKSTNERFSDVKDKGGIFQFYIKWHCYFNWNSAPCEPRYYFKRIARDNSGNFSGYKMRYAIYQNYNGVRHRELITVYGLRFLIMVKSVGEQFKYTSFLSNVGSYLGYFAIWTFITGVFCAWCLMDKRDLITLDESALSKLVKSQNFNGDIGEDIPMAEYANRDISKEHMIALVPA